MNACTHLLDSSSYNDELIKKNVFLKEENLQFTFHKTLQIISALGEIFKTYAFCGDRVAVFLPRGVEATLSIYSVLYIGAIYVPLNIADPTARITFLLNNTDPKLIIGKGPRPQWAENFGWFNIEEYELCNANNEFKLNIPKEDTLAAILHTSGSTGTPKGVALSHKAMIAFCDWAGTTFSINNSDIIANLAPFYFDLSVFDLYTSFRFGSQLVFMPQFLTINPLEMINWLLQNKITIWYTVPNMLAFLLKKGNISKLTNSNLRLILFAGEPISSHTLLNLVEALPNIEFYNLYGPVETNVCCYWKVNYSTLKELNCVPIGFPACSDNLKVDNSTNELMVKGPSLMSGYWTKNLQPHVGWYKTGDLVNKCKTGELVYKGRMDRMFKYKGFRIEPYEIEHILLSLPGIVETVVCLINDDIIAYVVANNIAFKEYLVNSLIKLLPHYMIPSKILFLDSLPKLPNGKIDLVKVHKSSQSTDF